MENRPPPAWDTALEQRVAALETANRSLKMEWEDVYDKLHKAAQRLNQRTRREKREEEPPPAEESSAPAPHLLGNHELLANARKNRGRP